MFFFNCCIYCLAFSLLIYNFLRGRNGHVRMVVGLTTTCTYAIMARCTTLCDKVCQWLATGRWFSPGPPVSSTNKTDRHDITEILLKVALNTIKQTNKYFFNDYNIHCYQIIFLRCCYWNLELLRQCGILFCFSCYC
jgi:hypothetical protein